MNLEDLRQLWRAAFAVNRHCGIYGDFLYSTNQNRYGTGLLTAMSGPTLAPLSEMLITRPLNALVDEMEGKESHFLAHEARNLKGFIPGGNIWYTKAAFDHLIVQQVMEQLSPGYLSSIRSKTAKEYGQDWWWTPGELVPDRGPNLNAAIGER